MVYDPLMPPVRKRQKGSFNNRLADPISQGFVPQDNFFEGLKQEQASRRLFTPPRTSSLIGQDRSDFERTYFEGQQQRQRFQSNPRRARISYGGGFRNPGYGLERGIGRRLTGENIIEGAGSISAIPEKLRAIPEKIKGSAAEQKLRSVKTQLEAVRAQREFEKAKKQLMEEKGPEKPSFFSRLFKRGKEAASKGKEAIERSAEAAIGKPRKLEPD